MVNTMKMKTQTAQAGDSITNRAGNAQQCYDCRPPYSNEKTKKI